MACQVYFSRHCKLASNGAVVVVLRSRAADACRSLADGDLACVFAHWLIGVSQSPPGWEEQPVKDAVAKVVADALTLPPAAPR
jgi:hypothetical protein